MKKIINHYIYIGVAALTLGMTSCTDYLDKTADSDVNPEMAFMNFQNFQGFVEEAYNCIPNKESNFWCCTFNWGEDEIMNTGGGDSHLTAHIDLGDYRNWQDNDQTYLHRGGGSLNPTSNDKFGEYGQTDQCYPRGKEPYQGSVALYACLVASGADHLLRRSALC